MNDAHYTVKRGNRTVVIACKYTITRTPLGLLLTVYSANGKQRIKETFVNETQWNARHAADEIAA